MSQVGQSHFTDRESEVKSLTPNPGADLVLWSSDIIHFGGPLVSKRTQNYEPKSSTGLGVVSVQEESPEVQVSQ